MENKILRSVVISLLFLTFSSFVFAEDELAPMVDPNMSQNRLSQDTKGNQVIIQKLVWDKDEYAYMFDVEVQKKNRKGQYEQVEKLETKDNFIELSLEPGFYRYKILVYNLLRRIEGKAEWIEFEIIEAKQPHIAGLSPKQIFLEEKQDGIYSLNGRNLNENSQYIMYTKSKRIIKGKIVESNKNGTSVKIQFRLKDLTPGEYTLKVTNKGGLSDESAGMKIQYKKPVDFDLFVGYVCPIITFDDTFKKYMKSNIWPISATAGFTFIPIKKPYGYFGCGVIATYTKMFADFSIYKIEGNLMTGYFNLVYQLPLIKSKLVLDVHAGAGAAYFCNYVFTFNNGFKSEPVLNSVVLSCDVGIAMQYYFAKRFYTELRVDTSLSFVDNSVMNIITPAVIAGWQF